jgi:ribosome-associated toxin RatA of RatAB toxin-antitoxin module
MHASLVIDWQGIRSSVTTENKLIENQSITMNLVQGMIKHLTGQWQFIARNDQACQVKLSINIEFKNRLIGLLFSRIMQQVLNRITDAFCTRAKVLYG